MPIEFHCSGCNKLLRVPDNSAGRKAQCPSCEAILDIPAAAVSEPAAASPGGTQGQSPFAAPSAAIPDSGNPFQSPLAESSTWNTHESGTTPFHTDQLANRGLRFLGAIVDNLIYIVAAVPLFIGIVFFGVFDGSELGIMIGVLFFSLFVALAITILQWYLISTTGQSIAKRWLGMRIIRLENRELPGFVNGVLLRNWVPAFIGAVPYIGIFFSIADPLFIFGEQRRCIHDHIAGTIVVKA